MKLQQRIARCALSALMLTISAQALSQPAAKAVTPASAYPMTPSPGLYQALGEQAGIRALMDDFVKKLKTDARIGDQFKDTNLKHLSQQLTSQICQLSGGPCAYDGPDMKTTHANTDITRAHFNALVEVLQASMDSHGIPFARQNQLLALLAPLHRDVVNTP